MIGALTGTDARGGLLVDHNVLIGHLAGHLASILTMAAYLLKDILWLRLLTILSCFAGIAFNYFVPATPLYSVIYWNMLFAVINIVQIAIIIKERTGDPLHRRREGTARNAFQELCSL